MLYLRVMLIIALAWILRNHTVGRPTLNRFKSMGAIVLTSLALGSSNSLKMRFLIFFAIYVVLNTDH